MSASFTELAETVLKAVTLTAQASQAVSGAITAIDRAAVAFATEDIDALKLIMDRTHAETLRIAAQLDAALAAAQRN